MVNFAQGQIFIAGTFLGLLAAERYRAPALPLLLFVAVVALLAGMLLERVIFRRLYHSHEVFVVGAIGLGVMIENGLRICFPEPLPFPKLFGVGVYRVHGAIFQKSYTFPRLAERQRQLGATLSGGEQQMLAIGRALMRSPQLLILDEPSLGLSPILIQVIYHALLDIRCLGTTILLAEQSAHVALGLSDRAYVLETGCVVLEGDARSLRDDPRIVAAYLGGADVVDHAD